MAAGDEEKGAQPDGAAAPAVPLAVLFTALLRVGATAFGGPAMIAYIKAVAVTRRRWMDEKTFRGGVALCQSIPGATAMQAAAFVGLRVRGVPGGLATYTGFAFPGFLLMLAFSVLYRHGQDLPAVLSLFHGLRAIVVAIVANAALTFGLSSLRRGRDVVVAGLAAGALAAGISPILVVVAAGVVGCLLLPVVGGVGLGYRRAPMLAGAFRWGAVLLAAAAAGLAALAATDRQLFELSLVMLRADLFAFGGGFASIPLLQHELVEVRHWVDARAFMDGIALGQVTPGPIVITATFVGYLLRGLAGAVVATASIFFPSFIMLALALPLFDWLQQSPLFRRAVRGALLAFVGLLVWATLHFGQAVAWNVPTALLAAAALVALRRKVDVLWVVLVAGVFSVVAL